MGKDGLTLNPWHIFDFLRRIKVFCLERRNPHDVQDTMDHPTFKKQFHEFLDRMAEDSRRIKMLKQREPFLTVRVGTHKSGPEMREAILASGCIVNQRTSDLMSLCTFVGSIAKAEEEVAFVQASNAELGYPDGCSHQQSYEAGIALGWKLCSRSDAAEIRLCYQEETRFESLYIASTPIEDIAFAWAGNPIAFRIFCVERVENSLELNITSGSPDDFAHGDVKFVFRK